MAFRGTSPFTTELAPTTQPSCNCDPAKIAQPRPIQTSDPISDVLSD